MFWSTVFLLFLAPQGFLSEESTPRKGVWSCDEGLCSKREDLDSEKGMPFEVCKFTCETNSMLWPMPTSAKISNNIVEIDASKISIENPSIENTDNRYWYHENVKGVFFSNLNTEYPNGRNSGKPLVIKLQSNAIFGPFTLEALESYEIAVASNETGSFVDIYGDTVFGVRNGLETLSQLIGAYPVENDRKQLFVPTSAYIDDAPKYKYRGLLLDTSRNYLPMKSIYRTVDGMAASKLNVLHWHATDSHSFPVIFPRVANLSKFGAYSPEQVYTVEDISNLKQYAYFRGIRIVFEFDAPAHAGNGWQWGEDLAVCLNAKPWREYCVQPPCGQLNPISEKLYDVLEQLYRDIREHLAPVQLFHMGGDEVHFGCWESVSAIVDWMKARKLTIDAEGFLKLWSYFQGRAETAWDSAGDPTPSRRRISSNPKAMFENKKWSELYDGPAQFILWSSHLTQSDRIERFLDKKRYIIETWVEGNDTLPKELLEKGYRLILATKDAWYLDHGFWGQTTYHNWETAYNNRIPSHPLVLGGEAAMWGELVDGANLDARVWPRAAAVGERLWSDPEGKSKEAESRLLLHRERLVRRGVQASAIAPQWCQLNTDQCL